MGPQFSRLLSLAGILAGVLSTGPAWAQKTSNVPSVEMLVANAKIVVRGTVVDVDRTTTYPARPEAVFPQYMVSYAWRTVHFKVSETLKGEKWETLQFRVWIDNETKALTRWRQSQEEILVFLQSDNRTIRTRRLPTDPDMTPWNGRRRKLVAGVGGPNPTWFLAEKENTVFGQSESFDQAQTTDLFVQEFGGNGAWMTMFSLAPGGRHSEQPLVFTADLRLLKNEELLGAVRTEARRRPQGRCLAHTGIARGHGRAQRHPRTTHVPDRAA